MGAQITLHERYAISILKQQGLSMRAIARQLGRAPSTISRELARNRTRHDGAYRYERADSYARARRSRSRRNSQFSADDWELVEHLIALDWSPDQVAGWLRRHGLLSISYETIYLRIWKDKWAGGGLWRHLRQAAKKRRKRKGSKDSRGKVAGKRHISERPPEVEGREVAGHWEIDTVKGDKQGEHTVVTMVERATGYLLMGKLARHCAAETTERVTEMILSQAGRVATVTSDNGSEFHGYKDIEDATGALFYFATPHHSWERGTNENTNGLIRQYLPKRESMEHVDAALCEEVMRKLNTRPRKRYGYQTPEERYVSAWSA
jgi:IS30 family transposase